MYLQYQGVLTQVSRPTKATLNRLGVFTVSSLHAYICARSPSLLNNLLAGRGATKRRAPMLARSNSASGEYKYKVRDEDCTLIYTYKSMATILSPIYILFVRFKNLISKLLQVIGKGSKYFIFLYVGFNL